MKTTIAVLVMLAGGAALAGDAPGPSAVEIKVTQDGFVPREIRIQKDRPTALVFKRVTDETCITAIDIPAEGVTNLELPLDVAVTVTVTPKKAGVEKFYCSAMGMGNGKLLVSD